jgi:hypothetical protein
VTTLLEPLRLQRPASDAPAVRGVGRDWLLVLALLACYAVLQSAFVRPPQITDQVHYLVDGANLPHVSWPEHQGLRIGLTIPVWLLTRAFGYSEVAYYGVPYLTGAALVITTYWLGRLVDSRAAGVLAAVLMIANPLVLDNGSQLLPDLPAATMVMGAVTILLWHWRSAGATGPVTTTDRVVLVGVGVLLGWSYLVREFIVFWFPIVALVVVVLRLPWSRARLIVAGAAGMFVLELAWGTLFFGNPFARVLAALNQPASAPWRVAQRTELVASGTIPDTHVEMLVALPRSLVDLRAGWVLAGLFVVLVVAAFVVASPALRLFALWAVVPLVLLMAAVQVAWLFDNRILRVEKLRYWLPILPPLIVGAVVGILAFGRQWGGDRGRRAAVAVVGVVAVVSLGLTGADLDDMGTFTRLGRNQMLELREWAATSGQTCTTMWVDADQWRASARWVPMYLRTFWGRPIWHGEVRHLNVGDDFVDISELETGALIRSRIAIQRRRLEGLPVPDYLQRPPSSWRVLLATNSDRIRVLGVGDSTCARP